MYLNFVSLINVCLDVFLHGFILYGTVLASWTLVTVSFTMLGKFFYYVFFKHLLKTPIFFFSVPPLIQMFVYLMLSQYSLRLSWFVSIIFLYSFFSTVVISTITSSCSFIHSSSSLILLLIPSKCDLHSSYYVVHLYLFVF